MSVVYLLFVLLGIVWAIRYDHITEEDQHKTHRYYVMCLYLICMAGCSYGLGGDKFYYLETFEDFPIKFSDLWDLVGMRILFKSEMPLWTMLMGTAKIWFDSFYVVQFVEATLVNLAVCYVIRQYTHRYFTALLIYFVTFTYFMWNTDIMREGCALACCMVGIQQWQNGKRLPYFLMIALGALFHVSAAAALLYPISERLWNKRELSLKILVIAGGIAFFIWFTGDVLFGKVVMMALGGRGMIFSKMLAYSMQTSTFFGFLRSAIQYLILPWMAFYLAIETEADAEKRQRKQSVYGYCFLIGTIVAAFPSYARFYNYAQIFYIIALADIAFTLFVERKHRILRMGTVVCMYFFVFIVYWHTYWPKCDTYYYQLWFPYTTFNSSFSDVSYREIAHNEAMELDVTDENTRTIQ